MGERLCVCVRARELRLEVAALPEGARIEYWYNEDYGWIEGELVKAERIAGEVVWWAVKFPVDGTTENLKLNMDTKARWRLKRSSG